MIDCRGEFSCSRTSALEYKIVSSVSLLESRPSLQPTVFSSGSTICYDVFHGGIGTVPIILLGEKADE